MKAKEKKEIIEEIADNVGQGVHTGLRKWSEHPESSRAWVAISKIDDGSWEYICWEVARIIYRQKLLKVQR